MSEKNNRLSNNEILENKELVKAIFMIVMRMYKGVIT